MIVTARYENIRRPTMDARIGGFKDIPAPKTDFISALHMSAKAFEKFRYAFEGIDNGKGWMAEEICECVRKRIVELHPDRENLKYGLNGQLLPPWL